MGESYCFEWGSILLFYVYYNPRKRCKFVILILIFLAFNILLNLIEVNIIDKLMSK